MPQIPCITHEIACWPPVHLTFPSICGFPQPTAPCNNMPAGLRFSAAASTYTCLACEHALFLYVIRTFICLESPVYCSMVWLP